MDGEKMKTGKKFTHNGKKYILAGFGKITMKKYLINNSKKGEYITFNGKRTYI